MLDAKEQEKLFNKILSYQREIEASLTKQLITNSKNKAIQDAFNSALKEAKAFELSSLSAIEQRVVKAEAIVSHNEKLLKLYDQEKETIDETIKKLDEIKDLDKITSAEKIKEKKRLDERTKEIEKQQVLLEKEHLRDKKKEISFKIAKQNIENIGKHLGFASSVNKTWLGTLEKSVNASESIGSTISAYGKSLASTFSPANIFAHTVSGVAKSTLDMSKQLDESLASFNKATGTGGRYNQVIEGVRFGSLSAGIGMKEAAASTQALVENLRMFNEMSVQSQIELARTTALLEKLGIANDITAKNVSISTMALGMGAIEAFNVQKAIANEAIQLGLAPAKLAQSFNASIPKLAQYGKQSVQIFKSLATQSKATGIEIESLIGISQQFDTFEGAAKSAGKLNAILGGNLINSMELLAADESQRITMLRESISLSGKNWNEMSKFEKMAVASAAGIHDMEQASRLFGTSAKAFEETRKAQDAEALSTKTLTEYAKSATSAQAKFKLAIEGLTGASLPLLNVLTSIISSVLEFQDGWGKYFYVPVLLLTGAFYAISKVITFVTATEKALIAVKNLSITKTIVQTTVESARSIKALFWFSVMKMAIAAETAWNYIKNISILSTIKQTAIEGYKTAKYLINIGIIWALETAETAWNYIKNLSILSTIKQIAWEGIKAIALGVAATASFLAAFAEQAYLLAKNSSILSTIKNIAILGIETIGKWAATIATGALAAVEWLAVAATTALGIAIIIATSPITLIILGIAALIIGIVLLVKHFDSVNGWIKKITGGFFDFWDILLIITGPIGWVIEAGIKLYQNWDKVIGVFQSFGKLVSHIFDNILTFLKYPLNLGINTINTVITKANSLPGLNIPLIPQLAKGTANFTGGMALVGEKGPELVSLPQGANVLTNENSSRLSKAGTDLQATKSTQITKSFESMKEITKIQEKNINNTGSNKDDGNRTIVLELDSRELGRAVINIFNSKMKLNLL